MPLVLRRVTTAFGQNVTVDCELNVELGLGGWSVYRRKEVESLLGQYTY